MRGFIFRSYPQGRGAATPNLTQICNVLRSFVWRSTAAKASEVEVTFITRLVGQGILKLTYVTDRGYLAGATGNCPPNMTPIFNEIGTIAETRISPKRLVKFGNNLHCVIAVAQAYTT